MLNGGGGGEFAMGVGIDVGWGGGGICSGGGHSCVVNGGIFL